MNMQDAAWQHHADLVTLETMREALPTRDYPHTYTVETPASLAAIIWRKLAAVRVLALKLFFLAVVVIL